MEKEFLYESYPQRLERNRREAEERRRNTPPPPTLAEKINKWWENLPEAEKHRPFTMEQFVNRFGASSAQIGSALYSLGWRRERRWITGLPHRRVWIKQKP